LIKRREAEFDLNILSEKPATFSCRISVSI